MKSLEQKLKDVQENYKVLQRITLNALNDIKNLKRKIRSEKQNPSQDKPKV